MKKIQAQSPAPIEPGNIGIIFARAEENLFLSDVRVEANAVITKIVAGKFNLAAEEGKAWDEILNGADVKAGTFINLHVQNVGTEARTLSGEIDVLLESEMTGDNVPDAFVSAQGEVTAPVDHQVHTGEVLLNNVSFDNFGPTNRNQRNQRVVQTMQGAAPNAQHGGSQPGGSTSVVRGGNASYKGSATGPTHRSSGQGNSSYRSNTLSNSRSGGFSPHGGKAGIIQQLPPIRHGKGQAPHPTGLGRFPQVQAAAAQGIESAAFQGGVHKTSGIVENAPPVIHNLRSAFGQPMEVPSQETEANKETFDQVFGDEQRPMKYVDQKPMSKSSRIVMANQKPAVEIMRRNQRPVMPPPEYTAEDMGVTGDERAVLILRGVAESVAKTLRSNVPFHTAFRAPLMAALGRGMMHGHETPHLQNATEIIVPLTPTQMGALAQILSMGRGTVAHPAKASLLQSFERAFALDHAITQARAEQKAVAATG